MRTFTSTVFLVALAACGKSQPSPTTTPAPTAPATTAPPAAIDSEERRGEIAVDQGASVGRLAFTLRVPKGWVAAKGPDGKALDGAEGSAGFAPEGAGDKGPAITLMATACNDCSAEEAHARNAKAADPRSKVLRSELVRPGVALHFFDHDKHGKTLIVTHDVTGGTKAVVECMSGGTMDQPLWDAVIAACEGLRVDALRPTLGGELLAAEEAKVASCPAATTVTYTNEARPGAFGEVKSAKAVQERPRMVVVRIGNAEGDAPVKGSLSLELELLAAPGSEVTSGTFTRAPAPPVLAAARMWSDATPKEGDSVEIEEPDAPEGRASTDWSGDERKVEVVVVARTRDRICGRFHLVDATHEAKGEFNVPLEVAGSKE